MLYLVAFLITLLGGRVIPFFTEAVIPGHQSKRDNKVEMATVILLSALVLSQFIYPIAWVTGTLALAIAISQLLRVTGWYSHQIWRIPILWVLFTGMIWLIIGFTLLGLASFGITPVNLAKHAITVGGIGVLTYGMMARVALGHTGRPLALPGGITWAFGLIILAGLLRVIAGTGWLPWAFGIHAASLCWVAAFLLFTWRYFPILTRPRIDGKAG